MHVVMVGLRQRIHCSSLGQGGIRNGQQSVEKEEAALQARPMEAQHAKVPSSGLRVAQVTFLSMGTPTQQWKFYS